jgi:predicted nucleic acid-binding protein
VTFIFDACALIAFMNEEKGEGYEAVDVLIERADAGEIVICMSVVNMTEVYYHFIKRDGEETADTIMRNAAELPIMVIDTITDAVCRETARFKARYPMSLADAFLCAAAKSLSAVIVTKDREIETAEKPEKLSVLWIH